MRRAYHSKDDLNAVDSENKEDSKALDFSKKDGSKAVESRKKDEPKAVVSRMREDIDAEELLSIDKDLAFFSATVNSTLGDVKTVTKAISDDMSLVYCPSEVQAQMVEVADESMMLLPDIKLTADEIIPLLKNIPDEEFDEDTFTKSAEQELELLEQIRVTRSDLRMSFAMIGAGITKISNQITTGKSDATPESIDSISAFSDFFEENPQIATSSPFLMRN